MSSCSSTYSGLSAFSCSFLLKKSSLWLAISSLGAVRGNVSDSTQEVNYSNFPLHGQLELQADLSTGSYEYTTIA